MNRVQTRLESLFTDKSKKRFIPFITVGDPSLEVTFQLVLKLVEAGADVIELGVPYSDPLADGPVIQRASKRALSQGVQLPDALLLGQRLREAGVSIPLLIFTYVNPVIQYGIERFFADINKFDLDGAIIPDLPFEENERARGIAAQHGTDLIQLVAPTSQERLALIGKESGGFLYCVSSLGVTGVRQEIPVEVRELVEQARANSSAPIGVGFGISTPEQVKEVAKYADAVIVGSAIVQEVEKYTEELINETTRNSALENVKKFVRTLTDAIQ
ncbi:tryptophan synthase subunit alpha [Brevibacillus daliensis]|uniref:tryptophan synthase subunit alpha n=1 Tax=Brevibacillus daliensis TaxID=2892995 RepID=UPI001E309A6E|nr:tryptophan synthase subunit alpha [Brevibacillus daliensis]